MEVTYRASAPLSDRRESCRSQVQCSIHFGNLFINLLTMARIYDDFEAHGVLLALDVNAIQLPLSISSSLVVLHTKYTKQQLNDVDVYAYKVLRSRVSLAWMAGTLSAALGTPFYGMASHVRRYGH